MRVLLIGSGPNALEARDYDRKDFDKIVTVNNSFKVREDWNVHLFANDFPKDRRPQVIREGQSSIASGEYNRSLNKFGGRAYIGETMAFSAGFWALRHLKPRHMYFIGFDMVYSQKDSTHFYGTGAPDPLRNCMTLQSLEAKSARLMLMAAKEGSHCTNLSKEPESRLVFPREFRPIGELPEAMERALELERTTAAFARNGGWWRKKAQFGGAPALAAIDAIWLEAYEMYESQFNPKV